MKPQRIRKWAKIIPVNVDPHLRSKIDECQRLLGESQATTMRVAMRIGVQELIRIGPEYAKLLAEKGEKAVTVEWERDQPRNQKPAVSSKLVDEGAKVVKRAETKLASSSSK